MAAAAAAEGETKGDLSAPTEREEGLLKSHVYFFYDSEGSGGSAIRDHLIEVAVVAMTDNLYLEEEGDRERLDGQCYSSLCRCSGEIEKGAWLKHRIDKAMLIGQKPVREVLHELFAWIADRLREIQRLKQRYYSPVLVSHGGTAFDFPLLVTEVKRNDCDAIFRDLNLSFTDTHKLCEQLRSESDPVLRGSTKLSVSQLTSLYFQAEAASLHTPHRAGSDALALRRLFSKSPLSAYLHRLEIAGTESIVRKWRSFVDCQELAATLGLHKQKAKGLVQKGVSLEQLEEEYRKTGCSEQWLVDRLRSLGVRKPGNTCLLHFRQIHMTTIPS